PQARAPGGGAGLTAGWTPATRTRRIGDKALRIVVARRRISPLAPILHGRRRLRIGPVDGVARDPRGHPLEADDGGQQALAKAEAVRSRPVGAAVGYRSAESKRFRTGPSSSPTIACGGFWVLLAIGYPLIRWNRLRDSSAPDLTIASYSSKIM